MNCEACTYDTEKRHLTIGCNSYEEHKRNIPTRKPFGKIYVKTFDEQGFAAKTTIYICPACGTLKIKI